MNSGRGVTNQKKCKSPPGPAIRARHSKDDAWARGFLTIPDLLHQTFSDGLQEPFELNLTELLDEFIAFGRYNMYDTSEPCVGYRTLETFRDVHANSPAVWRCRRSSHGRQGQALSAACGGLDCRSVCRPDSESGRRETKRLNLDSNVV